MEEGDLIEIDIPGRRLAIVGIAGERLPEDEVARVLESRRAAWQPRPPKYQRGVLKFYTEHAVSAIDGGYMA